MRDQDDIKDRLIDNLDHMRSTCEKDRVYGKWTESMLDEKGLWIKVTDPCIYGVYDEIITESNNRAILKWLKMREDRDYVDLREKPDYYTDPIWIRIRYSSGKRTRRYNDAFDIMSTIWYEQTLDENLYYEEEWKHFEEETRFQIERSQIYGLLDFLYPDRSDLIDLMFDRIREKYPICDLDEKAHGIYCTEIDEFLVNDLTICPICGEKTYSWISPICYHCGESILTPENQIVLFSVTDFMP